MTAGFTPPATPVLELCEVVRTFGSVRAVDGISFAIQPGEVFTLLGPSGCGKSTTLRIVAGLDEPAAGSVYVAGRLVADGSRGFCTPPEKRDVGMVFQSYAIWPHMTVFENVAFPLQLRGTPKAVMADKVERALDLVGLEGYAQRPATNLSGGQQQRVALARAIVYEPKLLLLDEPLSNLDAKLREHMRDELRALQRRLGITVLFVTHDQAEAMVLSDRIAVLEGGRIEQIGTPMALYERPGTPFVRDFLGRVLTLEISPSLSDARFAEVVGEPDGLLQVSAPLASNGRCMIACRPEDVRLSSSDEHGPNWLSGTVENAAYLGDRVEYTVRTTGGRAFTVFGPRREPYTIGAPVALHIDTAEATLWPI